MVVFQRVYRNAHAAGRVYAVAGLHEAGVTEPRYREELRDDRDWVLIWQFDEADCVQAGDFVDARDTVWPPEITSGGFAAWIRGESEAFD